MIKVGIIYKITSPTDNVYIGQTSNYRKRMNAYRSLNCKDQPAVYNSLKKYGFEKHSIEIIESNIPEMCLNITETAYIMIYNSYLNGLNSTPFGGSNRGWKMSEKQKEHLRKLRTGSKLSQETRDKISEANKGRIVSMETRNKISIIHNNKIFTKEYKQHLSESQKKVDRSNYTPPIKFGSNNINSKLTEEIVINIKKDFINNLDIKSISNKYNISVSVIYKIRQGNAWKYVTI